MTIGDALFPVAIVGMILLGVWVGVKPSKKRVAFQIAIIAAWVWFAYTIGRHKL